MRGEHAGVLVALDPSIPQRGSQLWSTRIRISEKSSLLSLRSQLTLLY
jgi:hypothetical protein